MQRPSHNHPPDRGFALPITLSLLAGVTLLAIGAFSLARVDLATSHAYADSAHAEHALGPALQYASTALLSHLQTDQFIVAKSGTPDGTTGYYTALHVPGEGWELVPLFSGASPVGRGGSPRLPTLDGQPTFTVEGDPAHLDIPLPPFLSELPHAAWVPYFATALGREGDGAILDLSLPATANTRRISHEYTFWIEDLGRYIDGDLAGNEGIDELGLPAPSPGAPHDRALGASAAEIALFTLFPDHRADQADLTTKDNYLFSPPTPGALAPRQLALTHRSLPFAIDFASASAHDRPSDADLAALSATLSFGTRQDLEPQLIPRGTGLSQSGDADAPKLALNAFLAKLEEPGTTPEEKDAIVREIAAAIQAHLPDFARLRKGGIEGMPRGENDPAYLVISDEEYLLNLAANIIDYADADPTPTVDPAWVPGTLPAYRGIDAQPLVMALYNHVDFLTRAEAADFGVTIAASDKIAPFKLDSWVQLWNPHNVPITGTVQLRIIEDRTTIQFGDFPAIPSATWAPVEVSLQPNQFLTVHFERLAAPRDGTTYNIILARADPATAFVPDSIVIDDNPNYNKHDAGFELLWEGALADATRGRTLNRPHQVLVRQERQGTSNANGNPWAWFGQSVIESFKSSDVIGTQNCDPRGTLYSVGYHYGRFDQHFYYRTAAYNATGPWGGGYVRGYASSSLQRPQYWADPSHAVTVHCRQTPNYNTLPTNVSPPASLSRPEDAPSYLSNRGLYLSLGELGHVFDPGAWTNALKTDTPEDISSQPSGLSGGQTLRIGQPEFARFDREGVRASHLLDLFSLTSTRPTKGLVNLNTADFEVLRALAAGILLDADPGIQPAALAGNRYAPQDQFAGDRFAQAVLESRARTPFVSPSALSGIELDDQPFFGNELQYPPAQRATSTAPAAREELFSKIHPLTSVRSRNFRIYIGGRIVIRDPSSPGPPTVLASRFRELTTFVRPSRDADGKIDSAALEIIHSLEL